MDILQVIIECNIDTEKEKKMSSLGKIKYRLPMINSYVLEIPESALPKIQALSNVKSIYKTTHITAQMHSARKIVKASYAHKNGFSGKDIGIAILDTGVGPIEDLRFPKNRIIAFKDFVNNKSEAYDDNGHGTHVAGIAAGNGFLSNGKYMGIAPEANIIGIKVLDEFGKGNSVDVLAGIQWMIDNKEKYNIKIANLSVGTPDNGINDPLVKAAEIAWENGIVVNVAAGNNGPNPNTITSPGISKKVITVGSADDNQKVQIWDDTLVNFSGRGPTSECIVKPDLVAPGSNIISCLSPTPNQHKLKNKEFNIISQNYLQLSGTSMSTPIISGSIALLIQKYPDLKPDDIKYMLKKSVDNLNYPKNQQGWGLINIEKLLSQEAYHVR